MEFWRVVFGINGLMDQWIDECWIEALYGNLWFAISKRSFELHNSSTPKLHYSTLK